MTGCVKPKRRPPEAKRDRVDEGPFSRFVNAEAFMDPGFMESFARLHISARAKSRWRGETTVQVAASVVSARTSANGLLHSQAWPEPPGQNGDTLLFGR